MFEKLLGSQKPKEDDDNPLASAGGLARLIAELPGGDDADRLRAIDDWLDEIPERTEALGAGSALEAALEFDAAAHPARERLLINYFCKDMRGYGSIALLERLSVHFSLIGAAYAAVFAEAEHEATRLPPARMLLAGERSLQAWGRHRRIGRFRQRPPGKESFAHAHHLLRYLIGAGLHRTSMPVFAHEAESSPLREYLIMAYEETIPWGSLLPGQLELTARLISSVDTLDWQKEVDATVTHAIDLAADDGPRRYSPDFHEPGPTMRFLSTAKLFSLVSELRDSPSGKSTLPFSLGQMTIDPTHITAALQTLAGYWDMKPPVRKRERLERFESMRGAFGFTVARALVEATQAVLKGKGHVAPKQLLDRKFYSEFERSYAAFNYGDVDRADRAVAVAKLKSDPDDPLVCLANVEHDIPNLVVEQWTKLDISDTGLGVALPAILPRHAIGTLVAWREGDSVQWRVGILRRVARDGLGKPLAGIELIPGTPVPAVLHLLSKPRKGDVGTTDWTEWVVVILPDASATEVFAPSGSYVSGMPVDLISDLGERRSTMKRLVERNGDWDRIEIEAAAQ